jgi:hypothetical protein
MQLVLQVLKLGKDLIVGLVLEYLQAEQIILKI